MWGNSPSSAHRGARGWSTIYVSMGIVASVDLLLLHGRGVYRWTHWLEGWARHVLLWLLLAASVSRYKNCAGCVCVCACVCVHKCTMKVLT